MRKQFFLTGIIFFIATSTMAQSGFLLGAGRASIEPDPSIVSTGLAGYGLPREGRFSIVWKEVDALQDFRALTGTREQFYGLTRDGDLLTGILTDQEIDWKKSGRGDNFKSLFATRTDLYALDQNRLLVAAKVDGKLSWTRLGSIRRPLKGLAGIAEKLVAVDETGDLFAISLNGKPSVHPLASGAGTGKIISLASDDNNLYAINEGDSLLMGSVEGGSVSWTLIGRNNGATVDLDITGLAMVGDRLYATTSDDKLYVSKHRSDGELSAMALAIKKDEDTALIISADLCGFEHAFTHAIRQTLSEQYNIPLAGILFNATHTHFSPVAQHWPALGPFYSEPNEAYMRQLREGILQAAHEALAEVRPAQLLFGRGTTEIGQNRRLNARRDAPYDNTLDVIVARDNAGKIPAMLFMTACHPVFQNTGAESFTISANYPAVARQEIKRRTGAAEAIFLQGFGGDINPADVSHDTTGLALADDVTSILSGDLLPIDGGMAYRLDTLHLPIETWSRDSISAFRKRNQPLKGNLEAERNVRWADVMLKLYAEGKFPSTLPLYVQTLSIGDWKLVGLSREVVNEYGPAIRGLWPDKHVSVAGYCNDVTSYLPADWHITTGVYEGNGSFFWYNAPGTFPVGTFDRIIKGIEQMRDE